MQFKGNLSQEKRKKPNFESDFDPLGTNLGSQTFFRGFYFY